MPEVCKNCGHAIGRLETGHIYNGQVVCSRCAKNLEQHAARPLPIPTYSWLDQLGRMIMLYGILLVIFAVAALIYAVYLAIKTHKLQMPLVTFGAGLWILWLGTMTAGVGQAALAFRDLVRNSWLPAPKK